MLRILFLSADPVDGDRNQVQEEFDDIHSSLRSVLREEELYTHISGATSLKDLQRNFLDHSPNVVHFSGHGSESGKLVFKNPSSGKGEAATIQDIAGVFKLDATRISCVVLNACYTEEQAKAIAEYINCTIGVSNDISNSTSRIYSSIFYLALAKSRSIEEAHERGLLQLKYEKKPVENFIHLNPKRGVNVSNVFPVDTAKNRISEEEVTDLITQIRQSVPQDIHGKYQPFLQDIGPRVRGLKKKYEEGFQKGFIKTTDFWQMQDGLFDMIKILKDNEKILESILDLNPQDKWSIDKLWSDVPEFTTYSESRMRQEEKEIRGRINKFFETTVKKIVEKTQTHEPPIESEKITKGAIPVGIKDSGTKRDIPSSQFMGQIYDIAQRYYEVTGLGYDLSKDVDHCMLIRDDEHALKNIASIFLNDCEKFRRKYSGLIEKVREGIPDSAWKQTIAATADENLCLEVKFLVECFERARKGIKQEELPDFLLQLKQAMNTIQHNVFWQVLWSLLLKREGEVVVESRINSI
jgi:hypothetical protein